MDLVIVPRRCSLPPRLPFLDALHLGVDALHLVLDAPHLALDVLDLALDVLDLALDVLDLALVFYGVVSLALLHQIGVPGTSLPRTGGLSKYSFNLVKASSHSLVHTKWLFFFRHWNKDTLYRHWLKGSKTRRPCAQLTVGPL